MSTTLDQPFNVLGIALTWQLRSHDTDGQYCVLHATIPPGCMVPPHQHVEQEAFYMLEGTAEFAEMVDGALRWKPANASCMVNIPSDAVHGFRNVSDLPARCLIMAHPDIEKFFLEAATPMPSHPAPPTMEEIERVLAIARRYGQRFLPPPPPL
jgi:quercetin dioxygenase-like cupin family protein